MSGNSGNSDNSYDSYEDQRSLMIYYGNSDYSSNTGSTASSYDYGQLGNQYQSSDTSGYSQSSFEGAGRWPDPYSTASDNSGNTWSSAGSDSENSTYSGSSSITNGSNCSNGSNYGSGYDADTESMCSNQN